MLVFMKLVVNKLNLDNVLIREDMDSKQNTIEIDLAPIKFSQELRFTQWALTLIALAKPLHYAVPVELLSTCFASLLWQLSMGINDIEANCTLLHSRKLSVYILLPQQNSFYDTAVSIVELTLKHQTPPAAFLDLEPLPELYCDWTKFQKSYVSGYVGRMTSLSPILMTS